MSTPPPPFRQFWIGICNLNQTITASRWQLINTWSLSDGNDVDHTILVHKINCTDGKQDEISSCLWLAMRDYHFYQEKSGMVSSKPPQPNTINRLLWSIDNSLWHCDGGEVRLQTIGGESCRFYVNKMWDMLMV